MLASTLILFCATAFAAREEEVGVISGAKVRMDFTNDYTWGVGVHTGRTVNLGGSSRAWSSGWDLGLVGEYPTPASGLSVIARYDRTRHDLIDATRYLEEGWTSAESTFSGGATHRWLRAGVRWVPPLSGGPEVVEISPYVGGGLGADVVTTILDVPSSSGRARLRSVGTQPTFQADLGMLFEINEHLDLGLGTTVGMLMAIDFSEVDGPDRLRITGRWTSGLDVLGRF